MVNPSVQSEAEINTSARYLHLTGGGSYHSPIIAEPYFLLDYHHRSPHVAMCRGLSGVQTVEII